MRKLTNLQSGRCPYGPPKQMKPLNFLRRLIPDPTFSATIRVRLIETQSAIVLKFLQAAGSVPSAYGSSRPIAHILPSDLT